MTTVQPLTNGDAQGSQTQSGLRESSHDVREQEEELESTYRAALEQNPDSVPLLAGFAMTLRNEGKNIAALHYLRKALREQPDRSDLQLAVATLQMDLGDLTSASLALRRLTEREPDLQQAFFALGSALCRLNDYSSCIVAYERAVQLNPSDRTTLLCLAKALLSQHLYQQAIEKLEPYVLAHSQDDEARFLLGMAYREDSQFGPAESEFKLLLRSSKRPPTLDSELGSALAENQKSTEALPFLERAIVENPDNAEAHIHLIVVLRAMKLYRDAENEALVLAQLKHQEIEQDRILALRSQAKARVEERDFNGALRLYGEALEISPADSTLRFEHAVVQDQFGDFEGERKDLVQVLAADPSHVLARNQLGILEIRVGNYAAAQRELRLALAVEPTNYAALGNLAVADAHIGDLTSAIKSLKAALELNPDYEEGHRNLGVLFFTMGHDEEARRELEAALALDSEDWVAQEVLGQLLSRSARSP